MDVTSRKRVLRARLRAARATMDPMARAGASASVSSALAGLPELGPRVLVVAYAATPAEVDIDPWVRERLMARSPVALPWVDGERLRLVRVDDLERDLAPGWRGLREPRPERRDPQVDPDEIGAAVVPGVAFDAMGRRLGQGGGHIDRLLAGLSPGTAVIGVAFASQLVEEVPVEPHDASVDVVVTEHRIYRVHPS